MTARLQSTVEREMARVLDWSDKAVQPGWFGRTAAEVAAERPALDSLTTPLMTLDERALSENSRAMSDWCAQHGVLLAPHGKTTMSPSLWNRQLASGSWAITIANEPQLRVARGAGVQRILFASQFLRPEGLRWLAAELAADPSFEFFCWVDSVAGVALMDHALRGVRAVRPIRVLVERGAPGGRTGVRSTSEGIRVAEAVTASAALALAGVAGFEGSVTHGTDDSARALVDGFLGDMVELHRALLSRYQVDDPVLSAGGSAFFDRVAAILGPEAGGLSGSGGTVRLVIRSGAYLVHDDGIYREATPSAARTGPAFRSAMHGWARVLSMPEPGLAHLDAGKRDLPFDEGLPVPQLLRRRTPSGTLTLPLTGHRVVALNDQHAHVRLPPDSPLEVGDVVRLGLSHPCTAFDKWSLLPVLEDASAETPRVVDFVRTYF